MTDQRYCRNCGAPNLPDAKFCANCGSAFVSTETSPPRAAPSAAPIPSWHQPPNSQSPQPRTIFGLSQKAIVIGIVVVFLLLTLGGVALMATTTTSPTATPTTTSPTATSLTTSQAAAQHAFLVNWLENYRQTTDYTIQKWQITWRNNTAVNLQLNYKNETTNTAWSRNEEIMLFNSTDDATHYVNSLDQTGYTQRYIVGSDYYQAYERTAGHSPFVYVQYVKATSGSSSSIIEQAGEIVGTITSTVITS